MVSNMENGTFFKNKFGFNDDLRKDDCFRWFDKGNKGFLDAEDLLRLATNVVESKPGMDESFCRDLLLFYDHNHDQAIDLSEFDRLWNEWIEPLRNPVTALLVIDVQNDFIDGTLALKNCPAKEDGKDVIPVINELIDKTNFDFVFYSIDRHPEDHISFYENREKRKICGRNPQDVRPFETVVFEGPPKVQQKLWPKHCVKDSWGSMLHPELKIRDNSMFIYKGSNPLIDSYSAFWDNMKEFHTNLHEELQLRNVTHVFVCGLALDYCVSFTALDAVELGYATVVIQDAVRSTDVSMKEKSYSKLESQNCVIASSKEIQAFLDGKNVRLEFARILASTRSKNHKLV